MNQARSPTLPSFSGLSSAVKEAREYENSRRIPGRITRTEVQDNNNSSSTSILGRRTRQPSVSSPVSEASADGFERSAPPKGVGGALGKAPFAHGNSSALLLQDTLSPLLEEVDVLFAKGQEISASLKAQGNRMQEDDVSWLSSRVPVTAWLVPCLPRGTLYTHGHDTIMFLHGHDDAVQREALLVFGQRLLYFVNPGEFSPQVNAIPLQNCKKCPVRFLTTMYPKQEASCSCVLCVSLCPLL